MERQLVSRLETWLVQGGLFALLAAMLFRLAFGYLSDRHSWLLESQLVACLLLVSLLYLSGSLVAGIAGQAAAGGTGLLSWLCALSLLPRFGWPVAPIPKWMFVVALMLLGFSMTLKNLKTRRWLVQLRGHGFEWIEEWAQGKPFYARLLAMSVIRSLGRSMLS